MSITSDEFFERKMKTLFTRLDFNQNGRIENDDFENWCNKIVESGGLSDKWFLKQSISKIWNLYFSLNDLESDGYIEFPPFLNYMKNAINNDATQREKILETIPKIFILIDSNTDDVISISELATFYASLSINDNKIVSDIFDAIDSDYDGTISKEEFISFGTDFFLGQKPNAPSRNLFGPLV